MEVSEVTYGLYISTKIGDLEWPWTAYWLLFISQYFNEFGSFGGQQRHSSWNYADTVRNKNVV